MTENEQRRIFSEWLNKHKALLFKVVRAYTIDEMDRDDLFQEISIQVWQSVPTFRKESAVTTWLYRIALNTAIKWTKKGQRDPANDTLEKAEHLLIEHKGDDRLIWLYDEIHQLDEVDRSIALLLLDGFSYKQMAAILGITESNVGVKINRIKKSLIEKSKNYERV